jgi:predicted phosphodiesterase
MKRLPLFLAAVFVAFAPYAAPAQILAGPWVELGADNNLSVRVVVGSGVTACPAVLADGKESEARQRGAADGDFPITVCTAEVPLGTQKLSIGKVDVPVLPATINRVVVIGDTGCRIEGKALQNCDNTDEWPFPVIAKAAEAMKPDLVIHVGDYYYRETACPADHPGCAKSPYGDNWEAWKADFTVPAAPLFSAAPWVMVRGNHEDCKRGGIGWMRLLDPRATLSGCADQSPPYRLHLGGLDLLMFDDSGADDLKPAADKVAAYARQLATLLSNAPLHSWLLMHRPIWALAQGNLASATINQTVQAAIRGLVPAGLDMVLSGHLHDFTAYEFGPARPSQLIVGDSGDTMLDLAKTQLAGVVIDGMPVTKGFALERFGFFVLERNGDGWNGTLYGTDTSVLARCGVSGRTLDCHSP